MPGSFEGGKVCGGGASVVARHDDERLLLDALLLEGGEHPVDGAVAVEDEIAVGVGARCALKLRFGEDRGVGTGEGEEEEERLFPLLLDDRDGAVGEGVQHLLMDEIGGGDPFSPEAHAHPLGDGGRDRGEAVILDIGVGGHVQRAGDAEEGIKAETNRPSGDGRGVIDGVAVGKLIRLDKALPRGQAHAEVPLSDQVGAVPALLEHLGDRLGVRFDERLGEAAEDVALEP